MLHASNDFLQHLTHEHFDKSFGRSNFDGIHHITTKILNTISKYTLINLKHFPTTCLFSIKISQATRPPINHMYI